MPTYTQLETESYWDHEVITTELDWLGDELCRRTGRPRDAAGTKGDNNHLNGGHRSQEWILNSRWCTSRTYTVQTGLTATQARHIAALDFTPGSAEQMIAQCKRLMAAMKAGQLDEVRELYGNVNGDQWVDGWDNLNDRAVTSDDSHLWHWHLTFDRRHLTNRALMERIVSIVMGDDDMPLTPAEAQALAATTRREQAFAKGEVKPYAANWTPDMKDTETHWGAVTLAQVAKDVTDLKAHASAPVDLDALADKVAARLVVDGASGGLVPAIAQALLDHLRAHPLAPTP